jgi:hypothetical protein
VRANARIPVILKGAQVIEQVSAALQRCMGHFRSPGIDGEERRKDLMGISWLNIPPSGVKAFEERMQAPQLLFGFNGGAVRASTFGADINDIRSLGDELMRLIEGPPVVDPPVAAERIVINIDNTHDQGAARKSDASVTGKQFHLVLARILFQVWCLLQQP